MKSIRLALAFVRVPHLLLSLFLFPLLMSLAFVFMQIMVTGLVFKAGGRDATFVAKELKRREDNHFIRRLLYGDGARRPALQVCRWAPAAVSTGEVGEIPPPNCPPDRLDLAIQVEQPGTFDVTRYEQLFAGHVDRIHVCRSCQPDAVIVIGNDGSITSHSYSLFGQAILALPLTHPVVNSKKLEVYRGVEQIQGLMGTKLLHLPDVPGGVNVSELDSAFAMIVNVTLVIVIALWLALKAHRKVLDYFASNQVLLPLVAATGKSTFYGAMWLLTLARVGCFLCGAVPLAVYGMAELVGEKSFSLLLRSPAWTVLWLVTLVCSVALATVVASMADLRHRHTVLSFLYRYIPFLLAFLGAAIWIVSFLIPLDWTGVARVTLAFVPVIGLAPLFVAPIMQTPGWVLAGHAILSLCMMIQLLRRNARWFAAHLEEY